MKRKIDLSSILVLFAVLWWCSNSSLRAEEDSDELRPLGGIGVSGNGSFGHVPANGTNGLGYGFLLQFTFPLSEQVRLLAGAGYEVISLTRVIDGSNAFITDANPARISQQLRFISLASYLSYHLTDLGREGNPSRFRLWLDGGADLLLRVPAILGLNSAVQSDNFNDSEAFTPTYKVLFAVIGLSTSCRIAPKLIAGAGLQAAYNTFSASGYQLVSARLSLSLQLVL